MSDYRFQDVSQLNALLELLERRVSLLGLLTEALSERDIYVRIGGENAMPRCARCRWWPPTTACRSAIWARCRSSGRRGWTTGWRSPPSARPPTSCRASSRTSTEG